MTDLLKWWQQTTKDEIESMLPKVIEYGANDLKVMGDAMLLLRPDLVGKIHPEELAISFYALGKMARIVGTLDAIGNEVNSILAPLNLSLKVSAREVGKSGKIVLDIMPSHLPADKETPSASGDAVFDIYQIALNKAIATVLMPNLKLNFILMNEPLRSMSEPLAEQVTVWLGKLYGTVIMVVTEDAGEIQVTRYADHSKVEQL
jgi:hypothetical protein